MLSSSSLSRLWERSHWLRLSTSITPALLRIEWRRLQMEASTFLTSLITTQLSQRQVVYPHKETDINRQCMAPKCDKRTYESTGTILLTFSWIKRARPFKSNSKVQSFQIKQAQQTPPAALCSTTHSNKTTNEHRAKRTQEEIVARSSTLARFSTSVTSSRKLAASLLARVKTRWTLLTTTHRLRRHWKLVEFPKVGRFQTAQVLRQSLRGSSTRSSYKTSKQPMLRPTMETTLVSWLETAPWILWITQAWLRVECRSRITTGSLDRGRYR